MLLASNFRLPMSCFPSPVFTVAIVEGFHERTRFRLQKGIDESLEIKLTLSLLHRTKLSRRTNLWHLRLQKIHPCALEPRRSLFKWLLFPALSSLLPSEKAGESEMAACSLAGNMCLLGQLSRATLKGWEGVHSQDTQFLQFLPLKRKLLLVKAPKTSWDGFFLSVGSC